MREWAIASGMIDKNLKNHLLLRYEPDCAALSIKHELIEKSKNKLLKYEKYILIDAGGGTVDISCHQILDKMSVNELLKPSGKYIYCIYMCVQG